MSFIFVFWTSGYARIVVFVIVFLINRTAEQVYTTFFQCNPPTIPLLMIHNSRSLTMNTLYNTMVSSLPISIPRSSMIISTHLGYNLLDTCCPPGHLAPNSGMQNPSHMQALCPENPCLQLVPCPQQPIESTPSQPSIAIQDIHDALRHPRPINTLMFALALVGMSSLLPA
jgi:hypothetical protein